MLAAVIDCMSHPSAGAGLSGTRWMKLGRYGHNELIARRGQSGELGRAISFL